MNEGDTLSYQLFVFCIYVIDRDREGNARTGQDFALKQKHRQIGAGAHCDGFAIGDLEVDLEAEMPSVPVSRFLPIADWKPKAIETPVTLRKALELIDDNLPHIRRILIFDRTVDRLLLAVHRRLFPAHPGPHRLGFVCDVAHAIEDMVKEAVKIATKPLLLSHTAMSRSRAMGPTPLQGRQITSDHARAIAETGGSIGIWHFFPSLEKYVDGLKEMAEIVGADHVSIGTDQFDARGCVEDYTRWVHLVAAMLRGGFSPEEAGKIAGGNYLRIFRAAVG